MEKSYETFVTDLRKLLLAAMDLKEEEIYFSNDGEKYGCLGDRLFVESGHMEKAKTVCGLHTEELYKRYCQEHSFENIVHDCVREIKKVSENCVLCDLDDLKDYEKVKSRLFIRLLNADKNRTILKELVHHKIGDIALVVYYLAGEKEGYVLSAKIKKSFVEKWGKDADTVFEAALINTYFISPPRIYHWEKMLFDKTYEGDNFMDILDRFSFIIKFYRLFSAEPVCGFNSKFSSTFFKRWRFLKAEPLGAHRSERNTLSFKRIFGGLDPFCK